MPGVTRRLLVGGYTASQGGRAAGIATHVPGADGGWVEQSVLALSSPSYLVLHPEQPWVFVVTEDRPSQLVSARVEPDGSLTRLSTVPSGGDFGCHLALSPRTPHLVVAHYGSGSVASLGIGPDGRLGPVTDLLQLSGSGRDPERQEGPHPHQVVFDGDELLVPDLGTDLVHRLGLAADGTLRVAADPVRLPAGSGPRHLVRVGPDHLVVAGELDATLWLGVRGPGGGWRGVQTVPTSIAELESRVYPSAVRAVDDTVFVANRGAGTIAVFALDRDAHTLTRVQEFSCGGPWPRDVVVEQDRLWVAQQDSDVVAVFDRGGFVGPRWSAEIQSPSAACIVLLPRGSAR